MSVELRSRRGAVGTSPLAVALRGRLEAQMASAKATAGKRAARSGAVAWIDVTTGSARAEVRDELTGHGVVARWEVAPIPHGDREVLLRIAHAHPELPARLVAGELPDAVARELEAEEISLVPASDRELTHDCSCHDWPGPCTHLAALAYVLVEAVDASPLALLTLRGITLEDLAAPLRTSAPARVADPSTGSEPPVPGEPDDGGGSGEAPADDHDEDAPRFDPRRADAGLLLDALGPDVAAVLARFYGAAEPGAADVSRSPVPPSS